MKKLKRLDKADVIFGVLLTAVIFIHLSRIRLGNVDIDEGFYFLIDWRREKAFWQMNGMYPSW